MTAVEVKRRTMLVWAIVLLVCAAIAFTYWHTRRGHPIRQNQPIAARPANYAGTISDMDLFIPALMMANRSGPFLIVTIKGTDDFVQFTGDKNGVQFDMPVFSKRQKSMQGKLLRICGELGLNPYLSKGSGGEDFVDCDINGEPSKVAELSKQIAIRLFDLPPTAEVEIIAEDFEAEIDAARRARISR